VIDFKVAYDPNGNEAGAVSFPQTRYLVSRGAPGVIGSIRPSTSNRVFGLAVSPDGNRLYASAAIPNNSYRNYVIDTNTHQEISTFVWGNGYFVQFEVSQDNSYFYGIFSSVALVKFDAATIKEVGRISLTAIKWFQLSSDGIWVYMSAGNSIRVYDTATLTLHRTLAIPTSTRFLVNPENTKIYTGGTNGLHVHDVASGQRIANVPGINNITSIAIDPRRARVYVNDEVAGVVWVINSETYAILKQLITAKPFDITFSWLSDKAYWIKKEQDTLGLAIVDTQVVEITADVGGIQRPQRMVLHPTRALAYITDSTGLILIVRL